MKKKTSMGLKDLKKKWHPSVLSDLKRLELPTPDHEYGFSGKLLEENLSQGEWEKFADWMNGQTCMLDAKLGVINYISDVIRGIDFIRHGKPTYWD